MVTFGQLLGVYESENEDPFSSQEQHIQEPMITLIFGQVIHQNS